MQQRFHVAWAATYNDALDIKEQRMLTEEGTAFQIRQRSKGFEVVRRLPSKSPKDELTDLQYTKRKRKKRGYSFGGDL